MEEMKNSLRCKNNVCTRTKIAAFSDVMKRKKKKANRGFDSISHNNFHTLKIKLAFVKSWSYDSKVENITSDFHED